MAETQPNWSLLPGNPLEFFGLDREFDRKDLKRAYGRLIKAFKPETHPAEFQRIREAYEVLEQQLRYGIQQAQFTNASQAWEFSPGQPEQGVQVVDEIETAIEKPKETYLRLKKATTRKPQDYFVLATLSDIVDRNEENMYLKWMLTGLREHPRDPGLQRLTREYLEGFVGINIAASSLHALSKLIDGADFYSMTESVWIRLLEEVPFEKFAGALAACEKNLRHSSIASRLAFNLRIVRRAMWNAPAPWLDERLEFLNQHGTEFERGLEDELEFVTMVREYRTTDRETLLAKPIGKTIDALIEAYCDSDSVESMTKVAMLCDELARNGNAMIDSFRSEPDEQSDRILLLCSIIVGEVARATGLDFEYSDPRRLAQHADSAVSDLAKTLDTVGTRIMWMRIRYYGFPLGVLAIGPLILCYGIPYFVLAALVWIAFSTLLFFAVIKPYVMDTRGERKIYELLVREYEALWRPRLVRYVQATHASAGTSIDQLMKSANELQQGDTMDLILSYAYGDRTLLLMNQLQLFVH